MAESNNDYQIFVITTNTTNNGRNKTIAMNVSGDTTGLELKNLIIDRVGGELRLLRLIYAGRNIENTDTLAKRGIKKESTIHCVLRMLSCAGCPNCEPEEPQPEKVVVVMGMMFYAIEK